MQALVAWSQSILSQVENVSVEPAATREALVSQTEYACHALIDRGTGGWQELAKRCSPSVCVARQRAAQLVDSYSCKVGFV